MPDYAPSQLQQTLAATLESADDLRARCEAAVVQWQKASERMLPLHPLDEHADRGLEYVHGWRAAKQAESLPEESADGYRHGFDSEGRLRVFGSSYINYKSESIDELSSGDTLHRYLLDGAGRVNEIWEIAPGSCVHETFVWHDGRVKQSTVRTWLCRDNQWNDGTFIRIYDCEYDDKGRLDLVRRRTTIHGSVPREDVVFSRPKRSQSLESAFKEVEGFLVEQIPQTVKQQNIKSPLYAILLTYCGEDITSGWPQRIYLMPNAHRQLVLDEYPDDVIYRTWFTNELDDSGFDIDPCNGAAYAELRTRALRALQLAHDAQDFKYDELRKLLCRVAWRLNELDWTSIVPVTEDFVVTAVDDHGEEDPFLDWKASIPPTKLEDLQSRGSLPSPEDIASHDLDAGDD